MRGGKALEVLAVNVVLLLGLYFVTSDIAERTAYAASRTWSYFFTPSLLLQASTLVEDGQNLQSPLTLAWLQVILLVLALVDALYLYSWVAHRRRVPSANPPQVAAAN